MEKIKSALEAAKQQSANTAEAAPLPEPIINKQIAENNDEINVNYQQTRVVPLNAEHLARNRIVSFNKNDYMSLGFDILRTQVLKKMQENGWRTIAITSPTPACGKTVVSINLGMSIAHHTKTTAMLVDFDLRRPKVAKYLGLPPGPSFNDVLTNDASIQEVLVNPGLERFVVLPTSKPVSNSSEVLSSERVGKMIKELRDRYAERVVIFDLPPLLGTDDAMTVLSQVDCVLVVVGNGMVSKTELAESMRYIDSKKMLGTVLNKSESKTHSEYYGY